MADSDSDYIQDSDDGGTTAKNGAPRAVTRRSRAAEVDAAAGWEVSRTWEDVVEGADGTIRGTVEGMLEGEKRRRLLKDTTPLQRGIIRHLLLVIDLSAAMTEKDLRPTRYLLTLRYAQEFVTEFFEQNPISQLGIIGMRDGLSVRVSDISGNPADHITKLQALRTTEPKGQPSLQNALEMARGVLFHAPAHTTREVLLIFGSLLSSDPGDIHSTIRALTAARIAVSVIGLAAQVAICQTLVTQTQPSISPSQTYNVALNEQHYRELFLNATTPPPSTQTSTTANLSSLLMMGFPSRITTTYPTLCACHSKPTRGGYLCSRCKTKVCSLPAECPACGLTLILSTHLARSYHHLFPLRNWDVVSWSAAAKSAQSACLACLSPFPSIPKDIMDGKDGGLAATGVSESGRYACTVCRKEFCIECDVFAHEVGHNCPGCQSHLQQ